MPSIHFDITADNDEALSKFRQIASSIASTTKAAEGSGVKIEDVLNHLSTVADSMLGEMQKVSSRLGSTVESTRRTVDSASSEMASKYNEAIGSMQAQTDAFGNTAQSTFGAIKNGFMTALGFAGVDFLQNGIKSVFDKVFETRGYFQDINSSMEIFLGNAEKASEFTGKLKDYAWYNAFEFSDLAKASQQLIAYRNDVEDVIPIIDKLSNIAVGTQGNLLDLVGIYNKAKSTGVVDSQALATWATRGVVVKDILKDMGENASGTRVTFEQLNKAIDHITADGGMFHDLQGNMMSNISMSKGQLEDDITALFDDIGLAIMPAMKNIIESGSSFVGVLDDMIEAAKPFFDTLNDASKAFVDNFDDVASEIQKPLAAINALLGGSTEEAGLFRNAFVGVAENMGKIIHVLEDAVVAYGAYRVALVMTTGIKKAMVALDEQEAAAKSILFLQKKQEILETSKGIAVKEAEALASAQVAAADTRGAATKMLLTGAYKQYTKAALSATAATLTNPYVLLGAALVGLAVVIYEVVTAEEAHVEATKALNKLNEEYQSQADERIEQAKAEKKVIEDTTKSYYERIEALRNLRNTYKAFDGMSVEDIAKMSDIQFNSMLSESETQNRLNNLKQEYEYLKEIMDYYKNGSKFSLDETISSGAYELYQKLNEERGWLTDPKEYFGSAFDEAEKQFLDFQKRLDNINKPKEVLIEEAKENEANKQEIFGWYERYKNLVTDFEEEKKKYANSPIMSSQVMQQTGKDFDTLMSDIDARIAELEKTPLKFKTEIEDLRKVRNHLLTAKEGWKADGTLNIPLYFEADMNSAKNAADQAKSIVQEMIDEANKDKEDKSGNYAEKYNAAKKAYQTALASYNRALNKQDNVTVDQFNARKKALETAKSDFEALGGKTSTSKNDARNRAKEQQAYNDLLKKQTEERKRKERESILNIEQFRIDLMKDSIDKTISQIELDYKKEQEAIDKATEDLKKAKIENARALWEKDPKNKTAIDKGAVFDESSVDTTLKGNELLELQARIEANDAKRFKSLEELANKEVQYMYDYLKEYGTMQEKRYALEKEYNDKIKKLRESGASEYEIKSAEGEKAKTLASYRAQSLAQGIDWSSVMTGVGTMVQSIADATLTKIDEYMKTDEYKNLSFADKESIYKLRSQVSERASSDYRSPFGNAIWKQLEEDAKAYEYSLLRVKKANDEHEDALKELKNAEEEYAKAIASGDIAKINNASLRKERAESRVDSTSTEVQNAQAQSATAQQNLTNTTNELDESMNDFMASIQGITSGSLSGFANGVIGLVKQITGAGKEASKAGDAFGGIGGKAGGLIGAILSLIDILGTEPTKFIEDLFNKITDVVTNVLKELPQIIWAAIKGIGNIIGGVFQGIGSWFGIGGSNESDVEKITQENNNAIKTLTSRIDLLRDSIDKNTGVNAIKAGESAKEAQQEINRRAMETLEEQMGAHGKHHSNAYYLDDDDLRRAYTKERGTAESASGTSMVGSIKGLQDIYNLTPEQIAAIKTYMPETWEILTKSGKYDKTQYWDAVVEQAGKLEEITKQVKDNITQWSLEELKDEFKSTLMDMDSSVDDFADNFKKKMMEAVLNMALDKKGLNKQLDEWYDMYYDKLAAGTLTEAERNDIMQKYQDIVNEGINLRNEMAELTAYGEDASQEATANGIKGITADQADQLIGRITAMQIAVEANKNTVDGISTELINCVNNLMTLGNVAVLNNQALGDILSQQVLANSFLEDIRKYNKGMYSEWTEKIEDISNKLSRL